MPKDTDHVALKGILRSRSMCDHIDAFLHSIDQFDIKPVHDAFDKARGLCTKLADTLFEADVALQLRAKDGPPAGPLFEKQAEEQAPAARAALEERATATAEEPTGALFATGSGVPGEAEPLREIAGEGGITYRHQTYGGGKERAVLRINGNIVTGVALLDDDEPWPASPEAHAALTFDSDEDVIRAYSQGGSEPPPEEKAPAAGRGKKRR